MQYLSKFISKDLGFGYSLDTSISSHDQGGIWALHHGKSKENGDPALVFVFDPSKARSACGYGSPPKQELAKSGLQRLKTLRHPDILKYASSVEGSDGTIYVATEIATPLSTILSSGQPLDREAIQWGLFTIARALGFMHQSGLIHAKVNASSVYVTPSGDWKLGGLEAVTQHSSAASLSRLVSLQREAYRSPEYAQGTWSTVAAAAPHAIDSWALGCLMYETHAGSLSSPDELRNAQALPKGLLSAYQKLLSSNPNTRAPAGEVPNHPYFKSSKFVELNMFIENLALKGQLEREAFLGKLPSLMDRLPDGFCTYKVLPMLSQSMETGTGGSAAFSCIVKMNGRLSQDQFANHVTKKYASRWYGNSNLDRNLRVELYGKMDIFAKDFDTAALNGSIFPAMCAGFQDMQTPALRDASVKSVLTIAPYLSEKNLNSVLMSHFARLQVDPEPAIRTNTTVCLGKLAAKLSQSARSKVLIPAFLRALKDPFPHARAAGVNAILITIDMYNVKDIATRVLPAVTPLLVDNTEDVRNIAFKVLNGFVVKLHQNHETMLRNAATDGTSSQANGTEGISRASPASSAGGWGLSSFTSMTAALLSKADTSSQSSSKPASNAATGISSDQFKKSSPQAASSSWNTVLDMPSSKAAPTSNGNTAPPASFSAAPLSTTSSSMSLGKAPKDDKSTNNLFDDSDFAFGDEDADEDGWGDMDIKPPSSESTQGMSEEDAFVAMMAPVGSSSGTSTFRSSSKPSSSLGPANGDVGANDLWNLAPPKVSKPKSNPRPVSTAPRDASRGISLAGNTRKKKSGGDDWEALLGGAGSTTKRKPSSRIGGSR